MTIKKLGHCCLVLEIEGLRIMTDPGMFTAQTHTEEEGIDFVLITHEHGDHLHVESLKEVLEKNPDAHVICNASVAKLLSKEDIESTHISGGESAEVKGVKIEGFGHDHAEIFESFGLVENTGYFVANKFFFPGDAFTNPKRPIDILALPISAPWMKVADAVTYLREIKPRVAFGVHDGMLVPGFRGFVVALFEKFAPDTQYVSLADGTSKEF
ncbi:MAG: MBL fold metallo-hydrolase [Patescibacteria group bacterium]